VQENTIEALTREVTVLKEEGVKKLGAAKARVACLKTQNEKQVV